MFTKEEKHIHVAISEKAEAIRRQARQWDLHELIDVPYKVYLDGDHTMLCPEGGRKLYHLTVSPQEVLESCSCEDYEKYEACVHAYLLYSFWDRIENFYEGGNTEDKEDEENPEEYEKRKERYKNYTVKGDISVSRDDFGPLNIQPAEDEEVIIDSFWQVRLINEHWDYHNFVKVDEKKVMSMCLCSQYIDDKQPCMHTYLLAGNLEVVL